MKGHDRLMDQSASAPQGAPDALCPACGLPPQSRSRHSADGITKADYVCSLGHIWTTSWLEVA
jgi:hypothetical protein